MNDQQHLDPTTALLLDRLGSQRKQLAELNKRHSATVYERDSLRASYVTRGIELDQAKAAFSTSETARSMLRDTLWTLFHSVNDVGDHTDDNKADTCSLCNVLKLVSAVLAATEERGV